MTSTQNPQDAVRWKIRNDGKIRTIHGTDAAYVAWAETKGKATLLREMGGVFEVIVRQES
jgi:hypothetical protein